MRFDNRFIVTILLLSALFSMYLGRLVVMGSELKDEAQEYVDDFEKMYQEELQTDDLDYGYYDEGLIDEIGYIKNDQDVSLSKEGSSDPEETTEKVTKGSRSIDPESIDPYDPSVEWLFHENMFWMDGTYSSTYRSGYVFKYDDFGDQTNTLIDIFTNHYGYYRYDFNYFIFVSPENIDTWLAGSTQRQYQLAVYYLGNSYGKLCNNLTNAQNGSNYNYPSNNFLTWSVPETDPTPTPDPDPTPTPDPDPTPTPTPDPSPAPEVDQNFLIVCVFALGVIAGCISSKFILRFIE